MPYFSDDDIAQVATPAGTGLIGVIRISGRNAFSLVRQCAAGLENSVDSASARGIYPCTFALELTVKRNGTATRRRAACPARAVLMPSPASYTCENVAEIHLPGSPPILRAALASLVAAGARLAAPGEFTFRAFRNGRLGLSQAEAVEEVVRAGNDGERRAALSRLHNDAGALAAEWRGQVLRIAARVEAALDFPEESTDDGMSEALAVVVADLEREGVAASSHEPAADSGAPRAALVGLANAGKSSLFNALVGEDAALVSPRASTTHDTMARRVDWDGVVVELSDNPGFDPGGVSGDLASADRFMRRLGEQDITVVAVDSSRGETDDLREFLDRLSGQVIVAATKSDLPPFLSAADIRARFEARGLHVVEVVETSSATGRGIGALGNAIARVAANAAAPVRWNRRERLELSRALQHCRVALAELSGFGRLEMAADDLRLAVKSFSHAMGEGYAEDALTTIFSTFCIGK